jgi:hypothetical protein
MRPIGFGLAAALALVAFAPATVLSAPKKVDEKARTQGMAEAPALAKAAGVSCQVTDARFIAKGKSNDKAVKGEVAYYEVDCDKGTGFVVSSIPGGTADANPCFQMNTTGKENQLSCILPGNVDPLADAAAVTQAAGLSCTPSKVRWIGQTQTKTQAFMEVACQEGPGYVLATNYTLDLTKPVSADNCLNFDDQQGPMSCSLTTKESRLAVVDAVVANAKNSCTIKDRRYVGMAQDKSEIFETSCTDGKGYIYKAKGSEVVATNCAEAMNLYGGCKLTDAREAMTEQAALYTQIAKKAGSTCEVETYQVLPASAGKDAVELSCKDGNHAVSVSQAGKPDLVLDCGRALVLKYQCSTKKLDTAYAALTSDLRKFDVKTCTVSDMRLAGQSAKGTMLLEVACSDGLKGYMLEYNAETAVPVAQTGCAFLSSCRLKGNT